MYLSHLLCVNFTSLTLQEPNYSQVTGGNSLFLPTKAIVTVCLGHKLLHCANTEIEVLWLV